MFLRRHKRAAEDKLKASREEALEDATNSGQQTEAQRLVRLLARNGSGSKRRRVNALSVYKPDSASLGDLKQVDWDHVQLQWIVDVQDLFTYDAYVSAAVDDEAQALRERGVVRMGKSSSTY